MDNRREREYRKKMLRERMIDSETLERRREEADEREYKERRRQYRRVKTVVAALLLLLAAGGILGYRYYSLHHRYREYAVKWEQELSGGSFSGYEGCGENVIKYTRDGAACLGRDGKEIWNQAYEMTSPFVQTCGDFAVIADRGGYSLYICDEDGCQGVVTTTLPISKASVSATGVTVAVLEDTKSNYIAFYDKTGTKLQIEIQTTLSGNGYPLDLCISPNGMLLIVSYVYLDEGLMQNQVVFYNFDEEGQNIKDRLVGGFRDYGSSMVPRVRFLDDTHACAFAQDGLRFYSLENTVQPELVGTAELADGEQIDSVLYSEDHAGMIVSGEGGRFLKVYRSGGKSAFETEVDLEYDSAEISGNHVLLYRDSECRIYSMAGNLKYSGSLGGSTEKLICLSEKSYIQIGPQSIKGLELKK